METLFTLWRLDSVSSADSEAVDKPALSSAHAFHEDRAAITVRGWERTFDKLVDAPRRKTEAEDG